MGFLGGLIAFGKWFDKICNWKNPISTVLIHILFFILVTFPELILPTVFLYLFLIGIWYYRWRPRNAPKMDTHPDLVRKRNDDLRTFYTLVDDLATLGERVVSLLRWRDPKATTQFLIFCLLASIVMYVTPFQIVTVLVGFYVLRHPKFRHHKPPFNIQDQQQEVPKAKETEPSFLVPDPIFQRFTLDQIQSATQNFDETLVIGCGGFGKVYKGRIKDDVVAIKRLSSMSDQGAQEFRAEVEMLSKIRHCNLVSLIGYCNQGKEMALVYEYMPEGSLADHLHKVSVPLSWLQLLKICIGAARGLDYLHTGTGTGTGTHHGIIHRDVKSSNVLLDKNFVAKISDFGLAKISPTNQTCTHVSTVVKGTFGYLDPCYVYTGELTRKSDVYSFGVVLLEVICGRPAVDTSLYEEDRWSLAPWAQERIKEGNHNHIVDFRLRGQISGNCLKDFVRIASQCLHNQPNKRSRMGEIVAKLELILSLQEKLNSSITEKKFVDKIMTFIFSGQ